MAEAPSPQGQQRRYLLVRTSGVPCAIPALSVRRVARAMPISAVPGSARRLVGLSHHDGDPIAVLDLADLLGVGFAEGSAHPGVTVVVRFGPAGEGLVGLGVDEALAVATADPGGATPGAPDPEGAEVVAVGGQLFRVVDLERLGFAPAGPATPGAVVPSGGGR